MKTEPPIPKPRSLSGLASVVLDARHQFIFDFGQTSLAGAPGWRLRKSVELHNFLALDQQSGRIETLFVDLSGPLRVLFNLNVKVPTLPDPARELQIAEQAQLGLTYPEETLRSRLPGSAFLQTLSPSCVWHPNASPPIYSPHPRNQGQAICLGARLPTGIPVTELVLMAFGALSLQSVQLDASDAAGIMNPQASAWWLQNRHLMPLSRDPFLLSNTLPQ